MGLCARLFDLLCFVEHNAAENTRTDVGADVRQLFIILSVLKADVSSDWSMTGEAIIVDNV